MPDPTIPIEDMTVTRNGSNAEVVIETNVGSLSIVFSGVNSDEFERVQNEYGNATELTGQIARDISDDGDITFGEELALEGMLVAKLASEGITATADIEFTPK